MNVFFYLCDQGAPDKAKYQHCAISLAEGLLEHNASISATNDYYSQGATAPPLFLASGPRHQTNTDVCVVTHQYISRNGDPFVKDRCKWVLIDDSDGINTIGFSSVARQYDVVLKSHFNRLIWKMPRNVFPWAFGLTNRILESTRPIVDWYSRSPSLLWNFRVNHDVRKSAQTLCSPMLARYWKINNCIIASDSPKTTCEHSWWAVTGRRHNKHFYDALLSNQASSCFGGKLRPSTTLLSRRARQILNYLGTERSVILQFDSYRFWESLAAGSLAVHVDLSRYGCELPVNPLPGIHYLGIDFDSPQVTEDRIAFAAANTREIALAGREWAIRHYSPPAVANRFLELL